MAKTTQKATQKAKTATQKASAPVIQEEVSKYDEELNKRIVPSQPEGVIATDQLLEENPELTDQGIKAGDEVLFATNEVDDNALETLSRYKALYPDEEAFCIASDGQVFLKKNLNDARNHQQHLTGKLTDLKLYSV